MFELPILQVSQKMRSGPAQFLAETVESAALLFVIESAASRDTAQKSLATSVLVACMIGAAYWFTASTSFANPAAVLGRMLSDSFSEIAPASALRFVLAQFVGGGLGVLAAKVLKPPTP
jgi:glycerol uptake facilitator-like aquaporin